MSGFTWPSADEKGGVARRFPGGSGEEGTALRSLGSRPLPMVLVCLTLLHGAETEAATPPPSPKSQPSLADNPTPSEQANREYLTGVCTIIGGLAGLCAIIAFWRTQSAEFFLVRLKAALLDETVIKGMARQGRFADKDELHELEGRASALEKRLGSLESLEQRIGKLEEANLMYLTSLLSDPNERQKLIQVFGSSLLAQIAAGNSDEVVTILKSLLKEVQKFRKKNP